MKHLIFPLILLSCSRVNVQEREAHAHQNMRHGIVPLTESSPKARAKLALDRATIEQGQTIYRRDCARCHGDQGEGDGPEAGLQARPPANLKRTVKEVSRFHFYLSISQWQGDMPGWKEPYSAAEIEALSAYLQTLRK